MNAFTFLVIYVVLVPFAAIGLMVLGLLFLPNEPPGPLFGLVCLVLFLVGLVSYRWLSFRDWVLASRKVDQVLERNCMSEEEAYARECEERSKQDREDRARSKHSKGNRVRLLDGIYRAGVPPSG